MKLKLLHTPEGVRDIYNGECKERNLITDKIYEVFKSYGYENIITPTFEFFDIFGKERGTVKSRNMIKFFDRDGRTLVLRPDMTPGVARCAAKYFEDSSQAVRLSYLGNTFIDNSKYQGRLKETTQQGVELIGDDSIYADAEAVAVLIKSLLASGLNEFQVEIGHVGYFTGLANEAGLSETAAGELSEIIRNKNMFLIDDLLSKEGVSDKMRDIFNRLPQMFGGEELLEEAKSLCDNEISLTALRRLKDVYDILKCYGVEKYVTFDIGMVSELKYYTGLIFKAYTYDVGVPVSSGGRYDGLIGQFGKDKPSIGFSIVVDILHQALKRQGIKLGCENKGVYIIAKGDKSAAIMKAEELRASGKCVTLGSDATANADLYEEIIEL